MARLRRSRLGRTVVLGAIAAGLGIWWLGRAYGVESSQLLRYLLGSALFVIGLVGLAVVGALLVRAVRRRRLPPAIMGSRSKREDQGG